MKIYTKTGDAGQTGLLGSARVAKDHPRIEAYGDVDELNAGLGLARAAGLPPDLDDVVRRVQSELFHLGAQLAAPDPERLPIALIEQRHVAQLEEDIDRFEQTLAPLTAFILPGGAPSAAALHVARTVCRRAERRAVTLAALPDERVSPLVVIYLNRLSDFLFVAARVANAQRGIEDVVWRPTKSH